MYRPLRLALAASLMAGAAACGSAAATPTPPTPGLPTLPPTTALATTAPTWAPGATPTTNICAFLTASEAAALTGTNVDQTPVNDTASSNECIYNGDAGSSATGVSAAVPNGFSQRDLQHALEGVSHSYSAEYPVSGLGDMAIKQVGTNQATVAAVQGDTMVIVMVSTTGRDPAAVESDIEGVVKLAFSS